MSKAWMIVAAGIGASCFAIRANAAEQIDGSAGPPPSAALKTWVNAHGCNACHGIDEVRIGPPFRAVAIRYRDADEKVRATLAEKIVQGGAGNWGIVPMIAHPKVTLDASATAVAEILKLAPGAHE